MPARSRLVAIVMIEREGLDVSTGFFVLVAAIYTLAGR
jgi:hypothetical protein